MTPICTVSNRRKSTEHVWTLAGQLAAGESMQLVKICRSPFRIGQRPDLELTISNVAVSGLHACVVQRGSDVYLSDYGSTTGTFVNGTRIDEDTQLRDGDWIEIGTVHLRVGLCRIPQMPRRHWLRKDAAAGFLSQQKSSLALTELLRSRKLEPCFQSIHHLRDRDVYGYEFLARSPVQNVMNPGQMFEIAEALGCEVELSMLCRDLGTAHARRLPTHLPLFLNTHPEEDLLEAVVPQMAELRNRHPERELVLEVHEDAIMDPRTQRFLQPALSAIGVRLAFDDFGVGVARIDELVSASADYIKFDAAVIRAAMNLSDQRLKRLRSLVASIRDKEILTVAEGVEDEATICVCRELGFDFAQGYALSRPTILKPVATQPESKRTQ